MSVAIMFEQHNHVVTVDAILEKIEIINNSIKSYLGHTFQNTVDIMNADIIISFDKCASNSLADDYLFAYLSKYMF